MVKQEKHNLLRKLPAIDKLLASPKLVELSESVSHNDIMQAARSVLDELRLRINEGWIPVAEDLSVETLSSKVETIALEISRPSLRRAVNATGVILHTGLGRAVLPIAACLAAFEAGSDHCTLEIDPETGLRGSRRRHYSKLLANLCGAEDALAVNNNAAAVFLSLNTLAHGREVIISRGQLVEIGGSFRLPDIMKRAGVKLVEVGTTNRTRISDYESAITDETAMIMRVHPSNFQVVGYTEEASLCELVELGVRYGIQVIDDLGSGTLVNLEKYGLHCDSYVQDSVKSGVDAVLFSADKLLGGPQAGLIVGKHDTIADLAKNPILRALRLDKLAISALEATLKLYEEPDIAVDSIPTLRCIARSMDAIQNAAKRLRTYLMRVTKLLDVQIIDGFSEIGGGSLPGQTLPTKLLAISSSKEGLSDPQNLAAAFRDAKTPVFGRVGDSRFLLDMRTVSDDEILNIRDTAQQIFSS